MLPLVTPDKNGMDIIADLWKCQCFNGLIATGWFVLMVTYGLYPQGLRRTLLATVETHCIPPIPFIVTVSDVPTRFNALATSSVTRVVSAPLSNKQLTVSQFGPRMLASNTRGVVSSLGSDRVFFLEGVVRLSDAFCHDVRRFRAVSANEAQAKAYRRCFSLRPLLIQKLWTSSNSMITHADWTSWLQRRIERCNIVAMGMRSLPLNVFLWVEEDVFPTLVDGLEFTACRACSAKQFKKICEVGSSVSFAHRSFHRDCTSCGNLDNRCGSTIRKPDTAVSRFFPIAFSSNKWPFSLSCIVNSPSFSVLASFLFSAAVVTPLIACSAAPARQDRRCTNLVTCCIKLIPEGLELEDVSIEHWQFWDRHGPVCSCQPFVGLTLYGLKLINQLVEFDYC
ncbi:hypothetical protein T4B_6563 [Trichinella pseudospiralis]|uniref:Uncharacterized protein n=1 Tax=Trichinella pseudospiralis TaxID=6337 RepID=A0A0V1JDR9_TRIPS|nr:hypothetical protein T4B_6563 [Trichinella pseudospiralis]